MKQIYSILLIALLSSCTPVYASGPIKVVTTLPDLAEVVREVGGEKVDVESLLSGTEDAHFMDALPSFVRSVANADVVCFIGLDLESAWLPRVLEKSGKAQIQPGGTGYCETGKAVTVLDKPAGTVNRSMGDVHPSGNPHFNLGPDALVQAAGVVSQTLSSVKPEWAASFATGAKRFKEKMKALKESIAKKIKTSLNAKKDEPLVLESHQEFTYFFATYGIRSLGSIEDKPGVPPSAVRLLDVSKRAKAAGVKLALATIHSPEKQLQKFTELSGIPYVKLPMMVQKNNPSFNTIEKVQTHIAETILKNL